MYKIRDIDGQALVIVHLEDKNKKRYYTKWFFELCELENLFRLEFKNKPSKEELEKLIKECATDHAETIINNYSVASINMIVEDDENDDVDYVELELNWKGVDRNLTGLVYIDYENIDYLG